jgi:diketogulonate reductase-like aldo/keto reductase
VGAYRAAEKILADGRARAIGVCNHEPEDLDALASSTEVVPAVNQVELHPYFARPALRAADARHGIITQAWSPIGGVNVYQPANPAHVKNPLQDAVITSPRRETRKTPAQVISRW